MSTNISKERKGLDWKKEDNLRRMARFGFHLDRSSGGDKQGPQDYRRKFIQHCIESLVHSCQCTDANCCLPNCHRMKRLVLHTKACCKKTNSGCQICKQIISLCCYHTKQCNETKCQVLFCLQIKQKLGQHQLLHRLQQTQCMRRRMATILHHQNPMPVIPTTATTVLSPSFDGGGKGSGGHPPGAMQAALEEQEAPHCQADSLDKPQLGNTMPPPKINSQVTGNSKQSATMLQQWSQPPQQMSQPSAPIFVGPVPHQLNFPVSQPHIGQMRPMQQNTAEIQQPQPASPPQMAMLNMQQNQTLSQQQQMMWQQQVQQQQMALLQDQQSFDVNRLLTAMELMEIDDENE